MEEITIALCGNPNSGKTTVFNLLTGSRQKTGNWPGVTVEKKEGLFEKGEKRVKVVDLPGTYSLTAYSIDEKIARDFLINGRPDRVVVIVDSTNLERNLYLTIELLEMGIDCILLLNMMDLAEKNGIRIDIDKLSKALGIPVIPAVAIKNKGIEELKEAIVSDKRSTPLIKVDYGIVENSINKLSKMIEEIDGYNLPSRWTAIKLLEGDEQVKEWLSNFSKGKEVIALSEKEILSCEENIGEDVESYIIERRYGFISGLVKECQKRIFPIGKRLSISDRIDKIVLNRWLGIPIFLFFMWLSFKLVFSLGNPIADIIDGFFSSLSDLTKKTIGENWISSLISDGIIAGVGSVLVFLPNIMILFLIIGFLEDCGYMARAAFVMDRLMHSLGLHGKSFIPMILGFGCNIPGIMACRTLDSEKDRILTILINPFMSCSARLPIYILFAGTFFSSHASDIVFSMYILGIIVAIFTAILFKSLFFKEEVSPLIMELPPYRMPTFKNVIIQMWTRSSLFLKKAGTVIFGGVILIWLLSSMPPGVKYASESSLIGRFGKIFAPIFSPAGFGFWQAAVALIFGILAKEIVVGTLGTLFGVEEEGLNKVLPHYFTKLSSFSFMVMSLLYIPCIASIGAIRAETGSWKWTAITVFWSLFIGWTLAVIFYQLGKLLL